MNKGKKSLAKKSDSTVNNDAKFVDSNKVLTLLDLYHKQKYITFSHHHNSYNQFITDCLLREIETPMLVYEGELEGKIYKHKILFKSIRLKEPSDETSDDINSVLFPEDFKTRFLSYCSRVIADVEQVMEVYTPELETTETHVMYTDSNVTVGKIPIMVRSNNCNTNLHKNKPNKECPFNAGGYFILKGAEKAVIPQEGICPNRCLVFSMKDKTSSDKNGYSLKVFSKIVENINSNMQIATLNLKKDILYVTISQLTDIPVCILFKALGIDTDKAIINHIIMTNEDVDMVNIIKHSIYHYKNEYYHPDPENKSETRSVITQEDACEYLMSKISVNGKNFSVTNKEMRNKQMLEYLHKTIFNRDFLPHQQESNFAKACYLGMMCNKLLNYRLNRIEPDDRDSICNKRIENVGILMGQIFKQAWKKMNVEITKVFKKKNQVLNSPMNVIPSIKYTIVEQNMNSPLSKGTWPVSNKKGVAQMIQRYTNMQFTSIMRRVASTQTTTTTKAVGMRFAHNTQYGFYDIPETPEHGHNVGTIKQLSNFATITINSESQPEIIKSILRSEIINLADIKPTLFNNYTKVFLNGEWLGLSREPHVLTKMLKDKRILGEIEKQVGIAHNYNKQEIHINTDAGRLLRPLLRVENNQLVLTEEMLNEINMKNSENPLEIHRWTEFIMKYPQAIDYIDAEEQETLMIAINIKTLNENYIKMNTIVRDPFPVGNISNRYDNCYTRFSHCEIHPCTTYGNVLSNAILTQHNDAPRNYFAFSQMKQAMGIYTSNYKHRSDLAYNLFGPQRPLTYSRTAMYTDSLSLAFSQNPTVAIMMYSGYNQEDSALMNRASIERGLFMAESFKKESISITKTSTTQDEVFRKPEKGRVAGMKDANYEKLNARGFVPEETVIKNNDIIFGKTTPLAQVDNDNPEITDRDSSVVYKAGVQGVVDKVHTEFKNHDGFLTYSMRIRQPRPPIGGDKFCCYTSDHDVLTIDGWKPINELTMNDKVATIFRKGEDDCLLYTKPLEIFEYDYSGDLMHVKTAQIDMLVTPNHRMYVGNRLGKNFTIKEAKDVFGKRVTYKKNVEEYLDCDLKDTFTIPGCDGLPDLIVPMEPWLIFFGIWMAEGCVHKNMWSVQISTHKQRVKEALTEANKYLKFTVHKYGNKNRETDKHNWCYTDKQLVKYMAPFSVGAVNKSLPDWTWRLPQHHCRILIDGMVLGDGHTMENGTRRYDTSSTKLADDFQRLCFHAGWSANKTIKYKAGRTTHFESEYRGPQTIVMKHDAYRLTIVTVQNRPICNKKAMKDGTGRNDTWIKFGDDVTNNCIQNKVYCCRVLFDGVICVRRNGVMALSGNSRHGQKCTLGYIVDNENMPYTEEGIRPDLVISSCCIPSRMTIGQLIESIIDNYAAIIGKPVVINPFEKTDLGPMFAMIAEYKKLLDKDRDIKNMTVTEFQDMCFKYGSEVMYNGYDGSKMENPVFINITTYLRLKHLVEDKIHARARGPMTALLRQPPEGRAREGGLRLGEMERDVYIAHGMSLSIHEKFTHSSDGYYMHVCGNCGLIARKKMNKNVYICDACEALPPLEQLHNKPYIRKVYLPYACKIFMQEIMSVGILPRIITENNEYTNAI